MWTKSRQNATILELGRVTRLVSYSSEKMVDPQTTRKKCVWKRKMNEQKAIKFIKREKSQDGWILWM
jgi:hypothetical protein